MTTLMTYAGTTEPDSTVTRTGGVPLAPEGTAWPHCATCSGPMQFLAQIYLDDLDRNRHADEGTSGRGRGVLAVFMCQNDPGMCEEWNPAEGGNRAFLFPNQELQPLPLPQAPNEDEGEEDVLLLGAVSAVAFENVQAKDYRQARGEWAVLTGRGPLEVLGQIGGRPDWLQHDESPACPTCSKPMPLAVQLEEGPDHAAAMNFGGCGSGYAFACETCAQAVFLWQC